VLFAVHQSSKTGFDERTLVGLGDLHRRIALARIAGGIRF
jgi:hypothetical protein